MTGLAERLDNPGYVAVRSNTRYAPFSDGIEETMQQKARSRSGAGVVLVALLLLSGVTVAVAKGYTGVIESYVGSPEGILSVAWLIQGAIALLCFVFAVRWLRS